MSVVISGVEPGSPAEKLGVAPGEILLRIDEHEIEDVLDYRFYMTAPALTLHLAAPDGEIRSLAVKKGEYTDLGLSFDTYLMDKQRSCKNRCVFCFIDQLPGGMRKSLYFKDDDARMSFLFGNYITLTNLRERDIERILSMRLSPVNISVHTTNPDLRVQMMGNPNAGKVLEWLPRLAGGGIRLNAQLVLCPGLNDGEELKRSLRDLCALAPALQSVAVVPVGLTAHRKGLAPLRAFTREEAGAVIDCINAAGEDMLLRHGQRICYAADEFYLLAGRGIPDARYYGAFDQLENGVGLWSLLRDEFYDALNAQSSAHVRRSVAIATGRAAQPLIEELALAARNRFDGLRVRVEGVDNDLFGRDITVAGLIAGGDLIRQVGPQLHDSQALLIPAVMLRHERDLFLDGVSLSQLEETLGIPVIPVENDGAGLLSAILGKSL